MERTKTAATGTAESFTFQPGNGTRYDLVVIDWPEKDQFTISWLNARRAGGTATFNTYGYLSYDYFQEKMRMDSPADTAALLSFVSERYGREVTMPDGYTAEGAHVLDKS